MDRRNTPTNYCEIYGFDAEWRQSRLRLLGLSDADEALGERLRNEVLVPSAAMIVDVFYEKLMRDSEAQKILSVVDAANLKQSQMAYLASFGNDLISEKYFEERLRIGLMHAWVGVPLSLYLCAYQILQTEIFSHIDRLIGDREQCQALSVFVLKVATLDSSLASEVYHLAQIRQLETSVTRLRDERRQLHHAATTDALTGLENRNSLLPKLAQMLTVAVRTGQSLCIIMADLDHFKFVNDTHGHLVGDHVLHDTAARLRAALRDRDLLGRYGGEEFLAVLQDTSLGVARQVAERVRQRISEDSFNVIEGGLQVTISQGIAVAREGDSVEKLMERADVALYAAKQAGRNCVHVEVGLE